ncbi:Lsr2 family protein [Arthrobacter sp. AET 35A]|nr:Lsr2 family protein [Arthrobacter sp. AET 35A]
MMQRVLVEWTDDLTGEKAQETVRFEIDGIGYEIDLTRQNAQQLRGAFADYVQKARKSASGRRRVGDAAAHQSQRNGNRRIRQWAGENGYTTSARGRISQTNLEAYNDAHR